MHCQLCFYHKIFTPFCLWQNYPLTCTYIRPCANAVSQSSPVSCSSTFSGPCVMTVFFIYLFPDLFFLSFDGSRFLSSSVISRSILSIVFFCFGLAVASLIFIGFFLIVFINVPQFLEWCSDFQYRMRWWWNILQELSFCIRLRDFVHFSIFHKQRNFCHFFSGKENQFH